MIESVKDAIGLIYAPTHVRRMARAEADAIQIRAQGEVYAQDIRERAQLRADNRALRQQENVEAVVRGALPQLPVTVSDTPPDPDWIAAFFKQCEDVGDPEMQTIWSKILAGEVAQPGRFSRRTLEAVRLLTKEEAEGFTRLCGYLWLGDKEGIFFRSPSVFPYLATKKINYATLLHFDSIGLLSVNAARGVPHGESLDLDYHGQLFTLVPRGEPKTLPYPQFAVALLSVVGLQLALISGAEGDPVYPAIVRESLLIDGIVLNPKTSPTSPEPTAPPPQQKS